MRLKCGEHRESEAAFISLECLCPCPAPYHIVVTSFRERVLITNKNDPAPSWLTVQSTPRSQMRYAGQEELDWGHLWYSAWPQQRLDDIGGKRLCIVISTSKSSFCQSYSLGSHLFLVLSPLHLYPKVVTLIVTSFSWFPQSASWIQWYLLPGYSHQLNLFS